MFGVFIHILQRRCVIDGKREKRGLRGLTDFPFSSAREEAKGGFR